MIFKNTMADNYLNDLSKELSEKFEFIFNYYNMKQLSMNLNIMNAESMALPLVSQYAKSTIDNFIKNFKINVKKNITKDINKFNNQQVEMYEQFKQMQDKAFYNYLQTLNLVNNPFFERYLELLEEKINA